MVTPIGFKLETRMLQVIAF